MEEFKVLILIFLQSFYFYMNDCQTFDILNRILKIRGVVPGGAGGAMAPPYFLQIMPTSTIGFSDLPTALDYQIAQKAMFSFVPWSKLKAK